MDAFLNAYIPARQPFRKVPQPPVKNASITRMDRPPVGDQQRAHSRLVPGGYGIEKFLKHSADGLLVRCGWQFLLLARFHDLSSAISSGKLGPLKKPG